jgi:hypothetical protein
VYRHHGHSARRIRISRERSWKIVAQREAAVTAVADTLNRAPPWGKPETISGQILIAHRGLPRHPSSDAATDPRRQSQAAWKAATL